MDYADIAAYPESRVGTTIRHLFSDPQFKALLEKARELPRLFNKESLSSFFRWVRTFSSVAELQTLMLRLIAFNLRTTSDGLSYTGGEHLHRSAAHLFLSNHRSTALDTSYMNYVLYRSGLPTAYSAAGDNLMKTAWIQHLIRLNKGFVVKRNVEGINEKLQEARRLSTYVHDLLTGGSSVWIAHRGGRAKNGDDSTDSAVLKMLTMNNTYDGFDAWTKAVHITPMTISWEQLPQDEALAREVSGELEQTSGHRDLANILGEINGWKGRIHLAFGNRVFGSRRAEVVQTLDHQIQTNFRLWDANWLAYVRTTQLDAADRSLILGRIDVSRAERILDRTSALSETARAAFLSMYAQPVRNALKWTPRVQELMDDQHARFSDAVSVVEPSSR